MRCWPSTAQLSSFCSSLWRLTCTKNLTIVGNLGADPEMRYTPAGSLVTNFSVAVNARWTTADGTLGSRVTWYRVACWGRLAEACNQYLAKGRKVMITAKRIEAQAYHVPSPHCQGRPSQTSSRI